MNDSRSAAHGRALVSASAFTVLALVTASSPSCKDPPPPGIPMADLIRQGKGPLEVRSISRSIVDLPNGAAMFNVTLKNHANTTISMFNAVAVLFDGEGKPADPPTAESGWAELGGISADSEVQLSMALPGKGVARMRLVLKDLVYEAPNPLGKNMGTLGMKWNNKAWQDEVAKAKP